jgi:UDP-glucose 4-epimerase
MSVFGNEYGAPACAAIHDSLHVTDQAEALELVLWNVWRGGRSEFLDLGSGTGYSVMEGTKGARQLTGKPFLSQIKPVPPGILSA